MGAVFLIGWLSSLNVKFFLKKGHNSKKSRNIYRQSLIRISTIVNKFK